MGERREKSEGGKKRVNLKVGGGGACHVLIIPPVKQLSL
jgi:hypothetical protein